MSYPPPLLELPLHLVSMVLAQVDSMQSLGSAILSHSLFYRSFRDDKKHIVRTILRNQIPLELLHYAEAAFKAKFVDIDHVREVCTLLKSAFKRVDGEHNGVLSQEWPLDWIFSESVDGTRISNATGRQDNPSYGSMDAITIASTISKTYYLVEYFCRCFYRERLPLMREPMGGQLDPDGVRPSKTELFRIRRALYRFQMYCSLLFRSEVDFNPGKWVRPTRNFYVQKHFIDPFPPWVNEQLCCIHDYLDEVLSTAFDDVAAHDVHWGASSVDWLAQGRRNEHKQAFLTYGLPFLFKLKTSRGYDERLQILQSKGLPRTPVAMAAHLRRPVPTYFSHPMYIRYTTFDGSAHQHPILTATAAGDLREQYPGTHDNVDAFTSAPFRIWLEAHKALPETDISYWPEHAYLRKCGYVIWDLPIAWEMDLGVDLEICKWIEDGTRRALVDNIERQRGQDQMRRSWKERAAIHEQGGRGYWESG